MAFQSRAAVGGIGLAVVVVATSGCGIVFGLGDFRDSTGGGGHASTSTLNAGAGGASSSSSSGLPSSRSSSSSVSSSSASTTTTSSSSGSVLVDAGTPKIVVDQMAYDFGSVATNGSVPVTLTFTNTGDAPTGPLSAQVTGPNASQFAITTDGCKQAVLAAGKACTEVLAFAPIATQPYSATLTATASPGGSATVGLSGIGVVPGTLSAGPTTYGFGSLAVGKKSASQTFTFTNTGVAATGSVSTTLADPGGDFVVTDGCKNQTLAAGTGFCDIVVQFWPGSSGGKTLTMTVSATPGGTASATATGTGIPLFPLTVTPQGSGTGSVTSTAPGINCGATCSATYEQGTTVTLTATPAPGSTFTGWSGGGCMGTASTCQVPMNAAQSVTASFGLQTFTLTVARSYVGGAHGIVVSTSPTSPVISCGTACSQTYPYGTVVTLNAQPGAGYYLQGFTGGVTSTSYSPTVTITGDTTVTATFTPANTIFVSTTEVSGNLGGLAGGDAVCAADATAAGLSGTYVAWLSTSTVNAKTRLGNARGWVRPDGLPFGDTVALLTGGTQGQIFYPRRLSADGTDVATVPYSTDLLTGTQGDGTASVSGTTSYMCSDWTTTAGALEATVGFADTGSGTWTNVGTTGCSVTGLHLLCMGMDYQAVVQVAPAPASARTIFVTKPGWNPSTGYAGASTLCNSQAAGLYPGTYKPLLATSSTSAASGFTARGVPLVRPDGVVVSTDTAFLAGGGIAAPIELGPSGYADLNGRVFTGASSVTLVGSDATTCNNWSSKASTATGTSGQISYSAGTVFFSTLGYQPPCNWNIMRVYCLQE